MEEKSAAKVRKFRSEEEIIRFLQEYRRSGQSVKDFCAMQKISQGNFHRWKHKYNNRGSASEQAGFSMLHIIPESGLFAAVGSIRIYQPVSAAYLKELVS